MEAASSLAAPSLCPSTPPLPSPSLSLGLRFVRRSTATSLLFLWLRLPLTRFEAGDSAELVAALNDGPRRLPRLPLALDELTTTVSRGCCRRSHRNGVAYAMRLKLSHWTASAAPAPPAKNLSQRVPRLQPQLSHSPTTAPANGQQTRPRACGFPLSKAAVACRTTAFGRRRRWLSVGSSAAAPPEDRGWATKRSRRDDEMR